MDLRQGKYRVIKTTVVENFDGAVLQSEGVLGNKRYRKIEKALEAIQKHKEFELSVIKKSTDIDMEPPKIKSSYRIEECRIVPTEVWDAVPQTD